MAAFFSPTEIETDWLNNALDNLECKITMTGPTYANYNRQETGYKNNHDSFMFFNVFLGPQKF